MLGDEVCIGGLRLLGNLFLAPVAGWSDCVFRYICESFGAAFTYTEMVSAEAVVRGNLKTAILAKKLEESTSPYAVQLFGSDKDVMAKAAAIIFEHPHCDVIDINCGCPVPKIMKTGAGSALMADLPKLGAIIAAMKKAVPVPITLKIRLGLDGAHENFLDAAKVAIDNGASAITLHARTTKQGYSGKADWGKLAKLVDFVHSYGGSEGCLIKKSETFLYNGNDGNDNSIGNGSNIGNDDEEKCKIFLYNSDNSDNNSSVSENSNKENSGKSSDGCNNGNGSDNDIDNIGGAGKNCFSKNFSKNNDCSSDKNCKDGESSRVKVFGSGDIFSRADAVRMIDTTGVDGVMVARGAMGNPFIFCKDEGAGLSLSGRLEVALKELHLLSREIGEKGAVLEMRKRIASYIKGVSGGAAVRAKVVQAASIADYERILGELR